MGIKKYYEDYHKVKISDYLVRLCAVLSERYITDRFLPDKAIDLIDEACAMIKTELNSMPAELDEERRRIMQMEIEEAALKKETDHLSVERLEELQKEMAELRDDFNAKKAKWDSEKASVDTVNKLKEQRDALRTEIETAKRNYDLNRAAEIQYGQLPELERQLEAAEELYGTQIDFNFNIEDVNAILDSVAGIYSEEICNRIRELLRYQIRKYSYLIKK